ncbi:hypothetical protein CBR_g32692 [Chara braunii]|uniref:Ribosome production factor 2 homolog n=1 Tax=Chara braunii TaxID=69332 RepID=A0A388LHA3_CHABU|nr:hypothetical protein CBR_g32692 [Chara braunii]|eukprot:GBG81698.1 hypothetical protein CBR_g32692 [Chara braunii]
MMSKIVRPKTKRGQRLLLKKAPKLRIKPSRQKPMGLLTPLPIPDGPGESVSIDFSDMGIPDGLGESVSIDFNDMGKVSKNGYSQVMVDLIPLLSHAPTELVFREFEHKYILQLGSPKTLVSDRDPRFISTEWDFTDELQKEFDQAVASFFFENAIAFNAARSNSYKNMERIMNLTARSRKMLRLPGYKHLRTKALPTEYKAVDQDLDKIREPWDVTGLTLMTNGAMTTSNRPVINFLAAGDFGAVMVRSVDMERKDKSAPILARMWEEVIRELGVHRVNAICTDSAPVDVAARKILAEHEDPVIRSIPWVLCACHVCNLLMCDIALVPWIGEEYKECWNSLESFHHMDPEWHGKNSEEALTGEHVSMAQWWLTYGKKHPTLTKIAVKVLSMSTTASPCERNWSTFDLIHTKRRNLLSPENLQMLVFIHWNKKLLLMSRAKMGFINTEQLEWETPEDEAPFDGFMRAGEYYPAETPTGREPTDGGSANVHEDNVAVEVDMDFGGTAEHADGDIGANMDDPPPETAKVTEAAGGDVLSTPYPGLGMGEGFASFLHHVNPIVRSGSDKDFREHLSAMSPMRIDFEEQTPDWATFTGPTPPGLQYGVDETTLRQWVHQREKLEAALNDPRKLSRNQWRLCGGGRKPLHEDLEKELAEWIVEKNKKGLSVHDRYIQAKARLLYKQRESQGEVVAGASNKEEGDSKFSASTGWLTRFKRRNDYVSRCELTTQSVPEGASETSRSFIQKFHSMVETLKIEANNIFNMGQVPRHFELEPASMRTKRGSRHPLLRKSGACHKRFTITFTISLSGKMLRPHMLFSHLKTKPGVDGGVLVDINESGMCSEDIMLRYISDTIGWRPETALERQPVLLIIDSNGPHSKLTENDCLKGMNIHVLVVPPNMKRILQPLDVAINSGFLQYYTKMHDAYVSPQTMAGSPKFPSYEMITAWVAEWVKLRKADEVVNSFRVCGLVPKQDFDLDALHPPLKALFDPLFNAVEWNKLYAAEFTEELQPVNLELLVAPAYFIPDEFAIAKPSSLWQCLHRAKYGCDPNPDVQCKDYRSSVITSMKTIADLKDVTDDEMYTSMENGNPPDYRLVCFAVMTVERWTIRIQHSTDSSFTVYEHPDPVKMVNLVRVENEKKVFCLHGTQTSAVVKGVLSEIHHLKKATGAAVKLTKKNENILPFEGGGEAPLERMSQKLDCSIFAFGMHTKKRPHNLVIGRMFDYHVYDLLELGIERFKSTTEFRAGKNASQPGSKPCFAFIGEEFETKEEYKLFKSMILDLFRGAAVDTVNLAGIDRVFVVVAAEGKVRFRHCFVKLKKSGSKVPRIELSEMGPSIDFTIRRHRLPSEELEKAAMKTALRSTKKKVKNVGDDFLDGKVGRVYMPKQELDTMALSKMKGLRRERRQAAEARDVALQGGSKPELKKKKKKRVTSESGDGEGGASGDGDGGATKALSKKQRKSVEFADL